MSAAAGASEAAKGAEALEPSEAHLFSGTFAGG